MSRAFGVEADHKPLVPLFSGYITTVPLWIERMRVRLQGLETTASTITLTGKYKVLKQTTSHFKQSQWQCKRNSQARLSQVEFEPKETEEEFEKDIMAILKPSVSEVVTVQQLLEETHSHADLSDLKKSHSWRIFYDEGEESTLSQV